MFVFGYLEENLNINISFRMHVGTRVSTGEVRLPDKRCAFTYLPFYLDGT